jgi:hypothetical protein
MSSMARATPRRLQVAKHTTPPMNVRFRAQCGGYVHTSRFRFFDPDPRHESHEALFLSVRGACPRFPRRPFAA